MTSKVSPWTCKYLKCFKFYQSSLCFIQFIRCTGWTEIIHKVRGDFFFLFIPKPHKYVYALKLSLAAFHHNVSKAKSKHSV